MRPLTDSEKTDNAELARLAKKVAKRNAKRYAQEGGKQAKKAGRAILRTTGRLSAIARRRIKRMKDERKARKK